MNAKTEPIRRQKTEPRPNLFVIGAMKSGTSSLHEHLSAHPAVCMSSVKEPSFFVEAEKLRQVVCKDERDYLALFRHAGDEEIIGESSTNYSKRPHFDGVVPRIFEFNAAARIVYIMRDPVERTISHYWHKVRMHNERRTMLEAVRRDPHYRAVSHYAMQIAPYIERFGRQRVHTLTLQRFATAPREEMEALFRWLGVDARFVPVNLRQRFHRTDSVVFQARGSGGLRRLRRSRIWAGFSPWTPRPIRALGRRFAERAIDRTSVSTAEVIEHLSSPQRDETRELSTLLGREFPEWTTLWNVRRRG